MIKISSKHLGRAILYGTIFFSMWFGSSELSDSSFLFFLLLFYFLFGGLFLDAMKNLWTYDKLRKPKHRGKKK